jgi:hypothetical protein
VADYLRVPVTTLYAWRKRGYGPPSVRIGRGLKYRWADVVSHVKSLIKEEQQSA